MGEQKKGIKEFEDAHGGSRIKELEAELGAMRTRLAALASDESRITIEESESNTILFGVTGDRHFGSLYHTNAPLAAFYRYCEARGVQTVFDAGDMTDGHKIYRGQEFEQLDLGFDRQLERVKVSSPRSIHTKFITGNHDASFKHLAGADVGKQIEAVVPEYEFLADTYATHKWMTPNGDFTLGLLHPDGGTAYALSYRPQKIVEALAGGTKPDLLAIGHFHKAEFIPSYRNVAAMQTGTFQRQTPFMARKGSQAHVGGWIVEVTIGANKDYKIFKPEFVAFYK
jgi:predicted phosphodiesterase